MEEKFIVDQDKQNKMLAFKIVRLFRGETYENMEAALKYAAELAKKACVNTVKEEF